MTEAEKVAEGPQGFAANMKARRLKLGFSLREVEAITGGEISNAYLSQLENGKIKSPSAHVVLTLCAAYAIELEQMRGWLQSPTRIVLPTICSGCGRAMPLEYVTDGAVRDILRAKDADRGEG